MGRPRKYTPEQLTIQRRLWNQEAKRRQRELSNPDPEVIRVPPEVRLAQDRRIQFMVRALAMGNVTPNQYFLGDPVKSRAVASSLSSTEINAILIPSDRSQRGAQ